LNVHHAFAFTVIVTKLAGEFAATVLLCQLSYMLLVGNMAGLEPATFEGTVDFTTGELFGAG
jgi:hypothetical protein